MDTIQCVGLLAFSHLSQVKDEQIIKIGTEIKKMKEGNKHPFRFKLIKQNDSGQIESVWEYLGIRRCTNTFTGNSIEPPSQMCRECMLRNGKNEEYRSKNHGRVNMMFENKTSKLYGSPIFMKRLSEGFKIEPTEEIFCKMLQEYALKGLKPLLLEIVENNSGHPVEEMASKLKRLRGPNQVKTLAIDDSCSSDVSIHKSSSTNTPLSIFPKPILYQKGMQKIIVRKITYISPEFKYIEGEKYYTNINGDQIKLATGNKTEFEEQKKTD